jgi:hypothetical protein
MKCQVKSKDDKLEKIALKYQDIITDSYNDLAKNCFNAQEHRLEMKTDVLFVQLILEQQEDMLNGLRNKKVL